MAGRAKGRKIKRKASTRSVRRPTRKVSAKRRTASSAKRAKSKPKKAAALKVARKTAAASVKRGAAAGRAPRLDRVRRTLDETVPTPPSSLNMNRSASAARTGRAEMAESLEEHRGMSPAITAGDVDVDVEDAYFTGDEAPGGDNQTPDQDIVDDIGKALGVQYGEGEELKSTDKITERDKHRWEMDPASSEDYKDRK